MKRNKLIYERPLADIIGFEDHDVITGSTDPTGWQEQSGAIGGSGTSHDGSGFESMGW